MMMLTIGNSVTAARANILTSSILGQLDTAKSRTRVLATTFASFRVCGTTCVSSLFFTTLATKQCGMLRMSFRRRIRRRSIGVASRLGCVARCTSPSYEGNHCRYNKPVKRSVHFRILPKHNCEVALIISERATSKNKTIVHDINQYSCDTALVSSQFKEAKFR
jgi:hypothetical protein